MQTKIRLICVLVILVVWLASCESGTEPVPVKSYDIEKVIEGRWLRVKGSGWQDGNCAVWFSYIDIDTIKWATKALVVHDDNDCWIDSLFYRVYPKKASNGSTYLHGKSNMNRWEDFYSEIYLNIYIRSETEIDIESYRWSVQGPGFFYRDTIRYTKMED